MDPDVGGLRNPMCCCRYLSVQGRLLDKDRPVLVHVEHVLRWHLGQKGVCNLRVVVSWFISVSCMDFYNGCPCKKKKKKQLKGNKR